MEEQRNKYKKLYDEAVHTYVSNGGSFLSDSGTYIAIYTLMFNEVPHRINIDREGTYRNPEADTIIFADDQPVDNEDNTSRKDNKKIDRFNRVLLHSTFAKMAKYYEAKGAYVLHAGVYPVIVWDHLIIALDEELYSMTIFCDTEYASEELLSLVIDDTTAESIKYFSFVTHGQNGFMATAMKLTKYDDDLDLSTNYNDDLPNDKIVNFINSNESGLILLHGNPGTGKTYYIRDLMCKSNDKEFIILDPNSFDYITDASFIDLLLGFKNAVIVLEDCEHMLADRISGNNELATLLNLSDGILGDSFNFKFICTFNANISKLDKAILRKGRLKVKYEFKELTVDKVKKLAAKLGKDISTDKPMSLAEIYNYEEDNGIRQEKKIGFSK